MKKEKRDKSFIHKPIYPGGTKAMQAFIRENLKYPNRALRDKTEGTVHCRYRITHQGKVDEVDIISGLESGCNEEAIRLLKLLQFEWPKIPRGVKAHFHKTIRIHFRLPPDKPKERKSGKENFKYTLIPVKPEPRIPKPASYTYTITME